MATEEYDAGQKLDKLKANIAKIETLSERLVAALGHQRQKDAALHGPSNEVYMKAAQAYIAAMMQNPAKVIEHQVGYWGKTLAHYAEAQQAALQGKAPENAGTKDRRFANPIWETNPAFNFLKQQYLINAEAVQTAVADMDGIGGNDRRRVEYFTKQIVDMFAPTNFLATNPDDRHRRCKSGAGAGKPCGRY